MAGLQAMAQMALRLIANQVGPTTSTLKTAGNWHWNLPNDLAMADFIWNSTSQLPGLHLVPFLAFYWTHFIKYEF